MKCEICQKEFDITRLGFHLIRTYYVNLKDYYDTYYKENYYSN